MAHVGGGGPPIEDYALIGDCHSAALVARTGAIEWCCFHRFDQRPTFARLLDRARGGHVTTRPVAPPRAIQRAYRDGTNVLETRFETDSGVIVIIDAMTVGPGGSGMPPMELLRLVRCEAGTVRVAVEVAPRFDYGLTVPRMRPWQPRLYGAYAGADAVEIESDLDLSIEDADRLGGTTVLHARERRFLRVRSIAPHQLDPAACGIAEVEHRIERASDFWRRWSSRCTYRGPHERDVKRSALVLKALTNAPTGAIVAAPTTSLPEVIGGVRNWDYRYTWLRDAAMHVGSLCRVGYVDEARAFVRWLERTSAGRADDLQVVYGAGGERLLPEVELPLEGYAGSRPVRIGNGATTQTQLDVYGHVVATIATWLQHSGELSEDSWALVSSVVEVVEARYPHPDCGIWEVRSGPEHFVASKVMAWVAVARAIEIAEKTGRDAPLDRWRSLRDAIRAVVLERGVSRARGTFVRAFDCDVVDAALLQLVLSGFVPSTDACMQATLARVDAELGRGAFLDRYRVADALPGSEGAFVLAAFWRVIVLVRCGRVRDARRAFESIVDHANDVGLLAEEIDPTTRAHLGNFPQAFSHVGLVNAALELAAAEEGT